MFTFLAVLGWILAIGAIAMFVIYPTLRKEDEVKKVKGRFDSEAREETIPASHPMLLFFNRKKATVFLIVGILLALNTQFLFYARPGHQYFIVAPTGAKYAIFTSGVKMVMPLSRIQEWQKFVDIKVITEGESSEGVEGIIRNGIPIRFIDQVTAHVVVSTRMQLPTDEQSFVKLAEEFRHPLNLVNNTLVPTVREQVINTGYMFAAQDYISGSAADFRMTLDEQLKDGGYSVEKKVYYDTIQGEMGIDGQRSINQINTTYEVTKRENSSGVPVRNEHDITKNNIIVSQVIVDQVILNDVFKQRLEAQRDESAKRQLEQQKIKTAKDAQARIVAEGERDKAAERVAQEKAQVGVLITIETDKKKEETNKELAKIQLETAKLHAQALRVTKDAEAYANQRLVSAGLTPQEKAKIYMDTQIGVAKALAGPNGINMPTMYMGGSGGAKSSGDPLAQLLTMMMAQQSMDKIGKSVTGK